MSDPETPPDPFEEAFLNQYPNPDRIDCPSDEVLKGLASRRLPIGHPARMHIGQCSPCWREFRSFEARNKRMRRQILIGGVAALLLLLVGVRFHPALIKRSLAGPVLVSKTVDLWDGDAHRGAGEPAALESVGLPAALVRVKVILPRFSGSGRYSIAVTGDKYGRNVRARAAGLAVSDGPQEIVTVILDLRKTTAGAYFLETTREQGKASYYYPLKVM